MRSSSVVSVSVRDPSLGLEFLFWLPSETECVTRVVNGSDPCPSQPAFCHGGYEAKQNSKTPSQSCGISSFVYLSYTNPEGRLLGHILCLSMVCVFYTIHKGFSNYFL